MSLHHYLSFVVTLFGSLLGSFSNVVVFRSAESRSVIFPPSACRSCNHKLSPLDLIPVFGWIFLGGACRYCKEPISPQYPLVEAFMAFITGLSFYKTGPGLNFVLVSGFAAIWFVASVVFVRQEQKKYSPFLWAAVYASLLLRPLLPGISFNSKVSAIYTGAFFFALLVALIAMSKKDFHEYFSKAALLYILLLASPGLAYFWIAVAISAIIWFAERFETQAKHGVKAFFALNIVYIIIFMFKMPHFFSLNF